MNLYFISDMVLNQRDPKPLLDEWDNVVKPSDAVVILGNVASDHKTFWFSQIQKLPGMKILFCGDLETNRTKWYYKFGFDGVVPINESRTLVSPYGPILVSHIPAFESIVPGSKYVGLARKFSVIFDRHSCVLNIHGHTGGKGNEKHNTFDASYRDEAGQKLLNEAQILELKFKRS